MQLVSEVEEDSLVALSPYPVASELIPVSMRIELEDIWGCYRAVRWGKPTHLVTRNEVFQDRRSAVEINRGVFPFDVMLQFSDFTAHILADVRFLPSFLFLRLNVTSDYHCKLIVQRLILCIVLFF